VSQGYYFLPQKSSLQPGPPPEQRKGSKLMILVLGIALLVPAGFLVWMRLHPGRSAASPEVSPVASNSVPVLPPVAPRERPGPAMTATAGELPVLAKTMEAETSNVPAMIAEAPRLRATPLKLQAIFFNKTRPAAIINGKSVLVGDRINEFRVTEISVTSVTLTDERRTYLLLLD
jgi:hypothetical protein